MQQFKAAAVELETDNIGHLVAVKQSRLVFIKRTPAEVREILVANPDLCLPEVYESRYNKPSPKSIGWGIRSSLVDMGLVSHKQFM